MYVCNHIYYKKTCTHFIFQTLIRADICLKNCICMYVCNHISFSNINTCEHLPKNCASHTEYMYVCNHI